MACATVKEVEDEYANLEEYLHDYVDMLVYNAKRKLMFFYYFRNHGIILPTNNPYEAFPTYSKWMFYKEHKLSPFSFSS